MTNCWLYAGSVNKDDYGVMPVKIDGKWRERRVHRLVYEALVGEIPDKLVLDHLCRIPRCINPEHLEPVTDQINILRGIGTGAKHAQQTACKNGHPYVDGSYYQRSDGGRRCKVCHHKAKREWYHRHKV
jgi:hypothetical protein